MSETKTLSNVTLYLKNSFFGNINRIDCREVLIESGVKYAQYSDATRVTFLEKRKRKARTLVLTYRPFMVVLATEDAIDPAPMFTEGTTDEVSGCVVRHGRYACFDEGWVRDFNASLVAQNVTPLVSILE